MPLTNCAICGSQIPWSWEDAFNKFGFGDGDGQVMTDEVVAALQQSGFDVISHRWGLHNDVIVSIRKHGTDLIPATARVGYAEPRSYLPPDIIRLLDSRFPEEEDAA